MVPSFSEDVTRAMRRQPKRFSRTTGAEMRETYVVCVLISLRGRDVLWSLSHLFVRPGFRLFCVRLAVHYLAGFRENN